MATYFEASLPLAFISLSFLFPITVFFAIAAGAMWLLNLKSDNAETLVEDRLDDLKGRRGGRSQRSGQAGAAQRKTSKSDQLTSFLESFTRPFAGSVGPTESKSMSDLAMRLVQGGFRKENAPVVFKSLQMALGLGGAAMGGLVGLLTDGFTTAAVWKVVIIGGLGYYLPEFALMWRLKNRKLAIFLGLPDALDLMVVCVEAGLGLDQAMRKVSEEMVKSHPIVAEEFNIANHQLQLGRPRAQVLQALGERNGVDDLQQLASILIQADKFGSSVGQALRVQSETMRTQRMQIAEEKAAKTAVKMLFPLVIFIFPGIFVVLVGPAAISIARNMGQ